MSTTPVTPTLGDAMSQAGPPTTTPSTVPDNTIQQNTPSAPVMPATGMPPAANMPTPTPKAPPSPADIHAGLFKNILATLGGGGNRPVRDAQGNPVTDQNGQVQMRPAGVRQMGASIVSAAIASMISGMSTPTQMDAQGRRPDYSNAVAAGAKAAAPYTQKGSQDAAQKQADDERLRAYSTTDHNFKYHQMQMAADKSDRETQQDVVDSYSTQVQAMNNEFAKGPITDDKGNQVDLWKQQNISGDEVQKLLADNTLHITKDMVVPVGIIEVPNPNGGGTHPQTTFSVYNPSAVIHMSDEIRKDPAMAKLYGVANGTPLPIRVLANMSLDKGNVSLASSGTANWVKGFNNSIPKGSDISPIKDFDLQDAIDSDKTGSIKKLLPWINQYRSGDLVTFFDHMSKNPAVAKDAVLAAGVAKLQDAMGLDSEDISKMVQAKADKVLEANNAAITPPGFVPVPNANELESAPLQQALAATGVKIPSDFETLYKIAHGE